MTELQRRVYADRATWMGDPDFVDVPVRRLLSHDYLDNRFSSIDPTRATDSQAIKAGSVERIESFETTHFSVVDGAGNAVSVTTTLNGYFGTGIMVRGGGFFLNNEMDDFSVKPGVPNQFGLVGAEANAIAPQKRMLSSMTPTLVETPRGGLFMVLGTPGGSTIITSVFQTLVNIIDYNMDLQAAIDAPKTHAQWLPDLITVESSKLPEITLDALKARGHRIRDTPQLGRMNIILVHPDGLLEGAFDPTRSDGKAAGY
jgi:gamma-glutamyltranspeptidase/glutathione hydrolase